MLSGIDFKKEYLDWLKKNMKAISLNQKTTRLTSPFLDFNNDHIEIYIEYEDNKSITLTDAGETISSLEFANLKISEGSKRRKILQELATSYNISVSDDNELTISCSYEEFAQCANQLMQCMIKVSDMLMLSDNNIKTIFSEVIKDYFKENNVLYTSNVAFRGKSGFYSHYEFVLPSSKVKPERCITAINHLWENTVKSTLFSWEDTRQTRPENAILYAIVNDVGQDIKESGINAFNEYGIKCIPWSMRAEHLEELKSA